MMREAADLQGARRIRLLIVDDVPDTVQNVQKLLHFERRIQVVGVAASGREAVARAGELHPDVVLMDVNLRDIDGLRVTEELMRRSPTCVIMMSVQSDPEYFKRALLAGARGYLTKPFSSDELIHTILTAAERVTSPPALMQPPGSVAYPNAPQSQRKLIAVYSPKGGVGRSVIAANLAITLKRETQARVVLADANLQGGDAHVLLNINTQNSIDDLREAGALDQEMVRSVVALHEDSGIGLLRAPLAIESAEQFTADAMKAVLIELREHFDFVVVDTDTSFSEATLTTLEMADLILLVTTLEVTTINRVSQFFAVMERAGYQLDKVRLICNRVDAYYGIAPKLVEARLRRRFVSQINDDPRLVATSVNKGVPFVLSHRSAPITRALETLAKRVVELVQPQPRPADAFDRRGRR